MLSCPRLFSRVLSKIRWTTSKTPVLFPVRGPCWYPFPHVSLHLLTLVLHMFRCCFPQVPQVLICLVLPFFFFCSSSRHSWQDIGRSHVQNVNSRKRDFLGSCFLTSDSCCEFRMNISLNWPLIIDQSHSDFLELKSLTCSFKCIGDSFCRSLLSCVLFFSTWTSSTFQRSRYL